MKFANYLIIEEPGTKALKQVVGWDLRGYVYRRTEGEVWVVHRRIMRLIKIAMKERDFD